MGSNFYDEIRKKSNESDIIKIIKSMGSYAFDSYYLKKVLDHKCSQSIMRALVDNRCVNRLSFQEFLGVLNVISDYEADSFMSIFSNYIPLERSSGSYYFKDSASTIHGNCNITDTCRRLPRSIKFSGTQVAELARYSSNTIQFIKSAVDNDHISSISINNLSNVLKEMSEESKKLECIQILQRCIKSESSASQILEQFKSEDNKQKAAKLLGINYQAPVKNTNSSSSNQDNNKPIQIQHNFQQQQSNKPQKVEVKQQSNDYSEDEKYDNDDDDYYEESEEERQRREEEKQKQQEKIKETYLSDQQLLAQLKKQLTVKQQEFKQLMDKATKKALQIVLPDEQYKEINRKAMKQISKVQNGEIVLLRYELLMAMFEKIPSLDDKKIVFTSNMVQMMERQLSIQPKEGKEMEIYRNIYISQKPDYQKLITDAKDCENRLKALELKNWEQEYIRKNQQRQNIMDFISDLAKQY